MGLEKELKKLEEEIRKLLLDFENDYGVVIESVDVDTRNFAGLLTQIFLEEKRHDK